MKRALIAIILLSFLLAPLLAEAQPAPPNVPTLGPALNFYPPSGSSVTILSPINSSNYSNQIQLIFVIEAIGLLGQLGNVGVSIDGGVINSVTDFAAKSAIQSNANEQYWLRTTALANVILPNLSEGPHNATVYFGWQYMVPSLPRLDVVAYATVNFNIANAQETNLNTAEVDISNYLKPEIKITFPSNMSFNTNTLPLNFTIGHIQPLAKQVH